MQNAKHAPGYNADGASAKADLKEAQGKWQGTIREKEEDP
jgi:hypothetical protein